MKKKALITGIVANDTHRGDFIYQNLAIQTHEGCIENEVFDYAEAKHG